MDTNFESITKFPPTLIREGYEEAKTKLYAIKDMGDALDLKALKFLQFIIALVTALVAAGWAIRGTSVAVLQYFIWVAIFIDLLAVCVLIFGTLTGNYWHIRGEFPGSFFWTKEGEWYEAMKKHKEADVDARLLANKIEGKKKEIETNLRTLNKMVKFYRLALWTVTASTLVLALSAIVSFLSA